MKSKILKYIFFCLILAGVAFLFVQREVFIEKFRDWTRKTQQENVLYYCPMHPTYTSDRPGDCPICNMKLEKREESPAKSAGAQGKSLKDICYMHNCPMMREGKPCPMMVVAKAGEKVTCPVCGTHVAETETRMGQENMVPEGYASILLSPQKMQLIGIKTVLVQKRDLIKTIRTSGRVVVDETRIIHVHPKVEGWIEEIFARYEGDTVKKGEPLFSFYSPDFVSAQQEYLTALKIFKDLPEETADETRSQTQANVDSAKKRLYLWDITDNQIQDLEKRGTPSKVLVLSSPIDGIVLKKHVFAGEFMERGSDFYHLANLSTIWVDADLYEYDLPLVSAGQEGIVMLAGDSGKKHQGKVIFVAPFLKSETRTTTARLELSNPDFGLKPDMYVTVEIKVDLGAQLAVPPSAILDTGVRKIVFVSKDNGILEPREVDLGMKTEDWVQIKSGVVEGEVVVTSGNFLIDSESRLKSATEGMGSGGHQHGQ